MCAAQLVALALCGAKEELSRDSKQHSADGHGVYVLSKEADQDR